MYEIDGIQLALLQEQIAAAQAKPINSHHELQDEILKVLLFAAVAAKYPVTYETTKADTDRQSEEIIRAYQSDPRFHAFIKMQCTELMKVIDRYKPR